MRFRICLALSLLCAAHAARAQEAPSKAEMEKAHQSYSDGETAFRLGNFDEAVKKFEEAYRLIRFPTILYDIAQSYRRSYERDKNIDHLRRALDMYKSFLRDAPSTAKQRPIAERLVPELEKTIAAEQQRRHSELIAGATGKDGLFLADQLLAEGDASDAVQVLDRVLAARGNSREVLLGGLTRRALLAGQQRQKQTAIDLFERVLAIDPGYLLPDGSDAPTRGAFEAAQKVMQGRRALALSHVPPGEAHKGRAVRVQYSVDADPLGQVVEVALFYRAGEGAYSMAHVLYEKQAGAIEIPAAFLSSLHGGSRVDYYLAALDDKENQLATSGSAKEPFVLSVAPDAAELAAAAARPEAPAAPLYKRWWLWTVVGGVAVVGVALGVGLGVGLRTENPQSVPFYTP
jgi:tetratricopeptide (TPR) repeat protein